ncbi:hypothetical protein KPH14_006709 [Odynerus spinipes]|uniref:Uncharacterized protein n=1 Tax=Odynerus spinipes TaxID=1348599 RepID=A0AAD9RS31_9HYME|nr:hypothetical protein KPH14_006709 [Odynerus spinipes]
MGPCGRSIFHIAFAKLNERTRMRNKGQAVVRLWYTTSTKILDPNDGSTVPIGRRNGTVLFSGDIKDRVAIFPCYVPVVVDLMVDPENRCKKKLKCDNGMN